MVEFLGGDGPKAQTGSDILFASSMNLAVFLAVERTVLHVTGCNVQTSDMTAMRLTHPPQARCGFFFSALWRAAEIKPSGSATLSQGSATGSVTENFRDFFGSGFSFSINSGFRRYAHSLIEHTIIHDVYNFQQISGKERMKHNPKGSAGISTEALRVPRELTRNP